MFTNFLLGAMDIVNVTLLNDGFIFLVKNFGFCSDKQLSSLWIGCIFLRLVSKLLRKHLEYLLL